MKNVKSVLSHIFPKNSKLNEHKCFNKILSLLPKKYKDHTLYCYKKNNTLFFVLNHPGIKMEFNYNLNLINELLNIAKSSVIGCKNLDIKRVKAYVSNTSLEKKERENSNLNSYKEKAEGKFENYAKNQEIKEIFEKIKGEIRKIS